MGVAYMDKLISLMNAKEFNYNSTLYSSAVIEESLLWCLAPPSGRMMSHSLHRIK